jgi:hypothetical protein
LVPFHVYSPHEAGVALLLFELFGTIIDATARGQDIFELFISQYRKTPVEDHLALQLPTDSGDRALKGWVRQVDARDLYDGLPRGFLAGAIVKMWVAHRLDWAGELLGRRGEEPARDCRFRTLMLGGQ